MSLRAFATDEALREELRLQTVHYNSHHPPRELQFPSETGNEQQLKVETSSCLYI